MSFVAADSEKYLIYLLESVMPPNLESVRGPNLEYIEGSVPTKDIEQLHLSCMLPEIIPDSKLVQESWCAADKTTVIKIVLLKRQQVCFGVCVSLRLVN